MAECFDEFDAPSPMPKRFCSRISLEEYDRIGNTTTELALQQLMEYLDYNPTAFFDILTKKKQEEYDSSGFFALLRSKLSNWYFGGSTTHCTRELDIKEAKLKLNELKENLVKSFDYAQEAKGSKRRFSARLAEKRWRTVNSQKQNEKRRMTKQNNHKAQSTSSSVNRNIEAFPIPPPQPTTTPPPPLSLLQPRDSTTMFQPPHPPPPRVSIAMAPPPPPPPPPLPSMKFTPAPLQLLVSSTSLRQLATQENTEKETAGRDESCSDKIDSKQQSQERGSSSPVGEENDFTKLMDAIKNPNTRVTLKQISKNRGNTMTPPRQPHSLNEPSNMFNVELLKKFKNTQNSPFGSPPANDSLTYFSP